MPFKISEITTELLEVTGNDLIEVSELTSTAPDVYETRYWKPGTAANQNRDSFDRISFAAEYDNGTVTTGTVIDWNNANNQKITLGASVTLSFSNMGIGHKQLKVIQDATGGWVPTLPTGKWPGGVVGTFTASADAEDILSIYFDGSSYYYQLSKGWA